MDQAQYVAHVVSSRKRVVRTRSPRSVFGHVLTVSLIASLLPFGLAHAQKTTFDYYAARADKAGEGRRLGTVEQYHLEKSEDRYRAKQFDAALGEFEFILGEYPNHPQALLRLAEMCLQWKSPRCDVDSWFQKAIDVNPNVAATYTVRGIYEHRSGRVPTAIESYKRALSLDPNSLNANYNLGLAYMDKKEYALANEVAQRAYAVGNPPPGLREKLKGVGAWRTLDVTPPVAPGDTSPAVPPAPQSK